MTIKIGLLGDSHRTIMPVMRVEGTGILIMLTKLGSLACSLFASISDTNTGRRFIQFNYNIFTVGAFLFRCGMAGTVLGLDPNY